MVRPTGEVIFINSDQVDKTCPGTHILALSPSLLLEFSRWDVESVPKKPFMAAKIMYKTDTVFFLISDFYTWGWLLCHTLPLYHAFTTLPSPNGKINLPNKGDRYSSSSEHKISHNQVLRTFLAEVPGEGLLDIHLCVTDEGVVKMFCIPHIKFCHK